PSSNTGNNPSNASNSSGTVNNASNTASNSNSGAMSTNTWPMGRQVQCADKLIGKDVKNSAGEKIGKVEDWALNLNDATVAYLIIGTGGTLGMGKAYHGVPFRSVKFNAAGDELTLPLDKAGIDRSPGFDLDHLPAFPDLQVSQTASAESIRLAQ